MSNAPQLQAEALSYRAYVALGANLPSLSGPPLATLQAAAQHLAALGHLESASSIYETDPVGLTPQPSFLNAVVALRSVLEPQQIMQQLLRIEQHFGRLRSPAAEKGPRTLDLDLLIVEGFVLSTPALTLPHPQMHTRRFVLAPLADIAPDLLHPTKGKTIADLLAALPAQGANAPAAVRKLLDVRLL